MTPDLPPREATPALTNQLAEVATTHIRAIDVASTLPPACVALLLVDAEARNLGVILRRLREAFEPISITVGGRELRFTLSAGGGCYPQTATSGGELLRQAVHLMTRAKADGGDRLYLPA